MSDRRIVTNRFKWTIAAMLALAAVLNYVDRQTLALMAGAVQGDLHIDDKGYAAVVNAFLVSYMLGGLLAAFIVDRIGARWGMLLFVGWWSLASAATGLAHNVWQLGASRFALGLGEAGNWVASPKLVREWFPQPQRALAIGIYSSAAHFGAAIAPALMAGLFLLVGWRWTFVISGLAGATWLCAWLLLYRPDRRPDAVAPADPAAPTRDADGAEPVDDAGLRGWIAVMKTRGVWFYAVANSLTNPVWFFYLFWFPKYLTDERGLSIAQMGRTSWIVYASAGFGAVGGGLLSGWVVRRGVRPARARVVAMGAVAAIAPVGALNALQPSVQISLALGAIVAFCHTAWVTNQTALPVDLYPTRHIGKVMGIGGIVTGLVTIASTFLIGQMVATLTYRPMFLVIAVAYPLGVVAAFFATTGRSMADREAAA
ncbi:MFS transporter [Sphingomonas sp. AR_OL41]|uniref:MFS transporter n=1 Tax=Sphingomonas sp. AR_OL41 TaxID=3042729 RepID=UPI0024804A4A|nr:MFS transporter [Sphingomonas sp. AR_OL41]MDH7973905.1 MFS transporter [Sphingomonas sp. AR_OL41]